MPPSRDNDLKLIAEALEKAREALMEFTPGAHRGEEEDRWITSHRGRPEGRRRPSGRAPAAG